MGYFETVRRAGGGSSLYPIGRWSSQHTKAWESSDRDALFLCYTHGWDASDGLDFLTDLSCVHRLVVQADRRCDFTPVSTVSGLRELMLSSSAKGASGCVDFERLDELRDLDLDLCIPTDNLGACTQLEKLELSGRRKCESLVDIASLQRLVRLRIDRDSRLVTLQGVEALERLESLMLMGCRNLANIDAAAGLPRLGELWIERCRKINEVSTIGSFRSLWRLVLGDIGDLTTAKPIGKCTGLKELCFYNTNIVDGDLRAIAALPALRALRLRTRKHYRPKLQSYG